MLCQTKKKGVYVSDLRWGVVCCGRLGRTRRASAGDFVLAKREKKRIFPVLAPTFILRPLCVWGCVCVVHGAVLGWGRGERMRFDLLVATGHAPSRPTSKNTQLVIIHVHVCTRGGVVVTKAGGKMSRATRTGGAGGPLPM